MKKAVTVVGGKPHNIPSWLKKETRFHQEPHEDRSRKVRMNLPGDSDLLIILRWINHQQAEAAQEWADSKSVPCIVARSFSVAAHRAQDHPKTKWFYLMFRRYN